MAQLILRQVGHREFKRGKVLDQITQAGVGDSIFVGPLRVAEYAVELAWICNLNSMQSALQGAAHVRGSLTHFLPMGIRRYLKSVTLSEIGRSLISAKFIQGSLSLLVEDITKALVEQ